MPLPEPAAALAKPRQFYWQYKGRKWFLGARRKNRLEGLVNRIKEAGGNAVCLATDIKKHDNLVQLVDLACETYGHLDVIVNNAGIARLSRIDEIMIANWEEMIDVNINGTLYGIAAALPVLKKRGGPHHQYRINFRYQNCAFTRCLRWDQERYTYYNRGFAPGVGW